jgi:hypothetical protein
MSVLRTALSFTVLALAVLSLSGCVVESNVRRAPCPGGWWVEGHYGPRGRWHPGHWRCPGAIEVVEVD